MQTRQAIYGTTRFWEKPTLQQHCNNTAHGLHQEGMRLLYSFLMVLKCYNSLVRLAYRTSYHIMTRWQDELQNQNMVRTGAVHGPKISSPARPKKVRPGVVHCRKLQARPGPAQWLKSPARSRFKAYCWHKPKHNSAICMLNIINSGDGVIDSLHLQGTRKGWCGHEREGCGPQKRCMWASRPTSWAVCWPDRPDGFSKLYY